MEYSKPEVIAIPKPLEGDVALFRNLKIRFDCCVEMSDYAAPVKTTFLNERKYPPQWFKSEVQLSLEQVAHSSPEELGMFIKMAFSKLQQAINEYQDRYEKS